ncbi:MAG: hypothetical protein JRN02_05555 [Nitrososphaerota archaeon]|nr:hypothetical protein [Nitrososphaerota archaeon]
MPKQIFDSKTFLELLEGADKVVLVKRKEHSKAKIRKGRYLYTYSGPSAEVDKLIASYKGNIVNP